MNSLFILGLLVVLLVSNIVGQPVQKSVEFEGLIQKGPTYRSQISYDKEQGWRTVVRLRVPYHHAARIEWVNLNEYPVLDKPDARSRRQRIVFELVSREVIKATGEERWNTTYRCRIVAVER